MTGDRKSDCTRDQHPGGLYIPPDCINEVSTRPNSSPPSSSSSYTLCVAECSHTSFGDGAGSIHNILNRETQKAVGNAQLSCIHKDQSSAHQHPH